jgi:hypothetical protein
MTELSKTPSRGTQSRTHPEREAPKASPFDSGAAAMRTSGFPTGHRKGEVAEDRSSRQAMTSSDVAKVSAIARSLNASGVLSTLEHFETAVKGARASLIAAVAIPHGSVIQRVASWLGRGFGLFSSPVQRAQGHLQESLKQLRDYSNVNIKPITDEIQKRYQDRTFVRTSDTPRALVLASVPTEIKHLNHDFDNLQSEIRDLVRNSKGGLEVVKGLGESRIAISRRGQYGNTEILEFAFRREGKVTICLNGKEIGGMWNGLAVDVAKEFASGRTPSFVKKTYDHYTVKKPDAVFERGHTAAEAKGRSERPSKSDSQAFEELRRTLATLATDDSQKDRGIQYISGLDSGRISVARTSTKGVELLQVVQSGQGKVAIFVDGILQGRVDSAEATHTAIAFMNGESVTGRGRVSV